MTHSKPFRLQRYFSIAALSGYLIAVIMLTLFYRHLAINDIITTGESSNLIIAQTAFNAVKDDLISFLDSSHDSSIDGNSIPLKLSQTIYKTISETNVIRIKIFNNKGIVIYSTKKSQIGQDQSKNKGFLTSIGGKVISNLIYRDSFNFFDSETEEDNLIQSYVPVRKNATFPILGVFEIYTDVALLVERTERTQVSVVLGVALILVLLYIYQVYILGRAANVISQQQHILTERSRTLELLSAHFMNTEENEKKRVAENLHEGIAQSLAAVKLHLELAKNTSAETSTLEKNNSLENTIGILQGTIRELRTVAVNLRPSSIDDAGLIKTIESLCEKYKMLYTNIHIDLNFEADEIDIPAPMKIIIYRVVQEALENICKHKTVNVVRVELSKLDGKLLLILEDELAKSIPSDNHIDKNTNNIIALESVEQRIILSGGTFKITNNDLGGSTVYASWMY